MCIGLAALAETTNRNGKARKKRIDNTIAKNHQKHATIRSRIVTQKQYMILQYSVSQYQY
jgi:hypothetical protein